MKFTCTTTSQVEREYEVEAETDEQAKKRLRTYLADPGLVKEGTIVKGAEKNTTTEQIKATVPVKPVALKEVAGSKT